MQSTKLTDREAIAKVMLVRDDIRNYNTDKYKDMDFTERLSYMDALAKVINLALIIVEQEQSQQKTGLELFAEMLAERRAETHE